MNHPWTHLKTLVDGEAFALQGLNIWELDWQKTGETVHVKDPIYGNHHLFPVFEISDGQQTARFAAGEFSNNVWGIYTEQQHLPVDGMPLRES